VIEREDALQELNDAYLAYCEAVWKSANERISRDLSAKQGVAFFARELKTFWDLHERLIKAGVVFRCVNGPSGAGYFV
jgi:hypothetical protein